MRKLFSIFAVLIPVVALVVAASFAFTHYMGAKAAATCTPTGFSRDSIDLTAAVIDPSGTFSGTLDATGCNIGVYYSPGAKGTINNAEIFGANYYGVVNNGGHVTITKSTIHDIGEKPFNGTQHGVAIYFADASSATGSITNNYITKYQKGGIVTNGVGTSATITHNIVIGLGPVNFIAQNGIEVGDGAKATVTNNTVTDNSYTGSNVASSGGILVFGGACYSSALTVGTHITNNIVLSNDVGVFLSNLDASCTPTTTPTRILTENNFIRNDAVNNTSGFGAPGSGYQAGVSDQGDYDKIINNKICGIGYTPVATPPPYLYMIDVTVTNHPIVHGNTSCSKGSNYGSSVQPQTTAVHHMKAGVTVKRYK
jgi:Right handed beta helix region